MFLPRKITTPPHHLKPVEHIPFFMYTNDKTDFDQLDARFVEWFHKYQPEVVIGWNDFIGELIKMIGKRIPEDVGFVSLYNVNSTMAGLATEEQLISETSVRFLDRLIRTNERGIPEKREILSVTREWHDGPSLPGKHA